MMVGRLLSLWDGLFSGAMLNFQGVNSWGLLVIGKDSGLFWFFPPQTSKHRNWSFLREFRTTKDIPKTSKKRSLKGGMTGCHRAKTHPDLGSLDSGWVFCLFSTMVWRETGAKLSEVCLFFFQALWECLGIGRKKHRSFPLKKMKIDPAKRDGISCFRCWGWPVGLNSGNNGGK